MTAMCAARSLEDTFDDQVLTPFPARMSTLAIVGSTAFATHPTGQLHIVYTLIGFALGYLNPTTVISGGAVGVDTIGETIAERIGWTRGAGRFRVYRPQPNAAGKFTWEDSYRPRNEAMAQDCTHLLCIRSAASNTYGSGWTRDRAKELGKATWSITLPHEGTFPWPDW